MQLYFPWVSFMFMDPSTKHVSEMCSAVCVECFARIRCSESPGLGIIVGIAAISGTSLIEVFTLRGRGGAGVGVWCLPSFSVIMFSLCLILPGHQLLSEWCLLQHKTNPSRPPSFPQLLPHIHPSARRPCGQAAVSEAKFTRLEWLQWRLCFLLICWDCFYLLGFTELLPTAALTVKRADDWLIDWTNPSELGRDMQ